MFYLCGVMKRNLALILLMFAATSYAQKVSIKVSEQYVSIPAEQTQTEVKPGWTIADIKLKDKLTRYLAGGQAKQLSDDSKPHFVIEPGKKETLVEYALVKLQKRKQYRKFPMANLRDNKYLRIEPSHFEIKTNGDIEFAVSPKADLEPGEYVIMNIQQSPIGELQDYIVFPFQVK